MENLIIKIKTYPIINIFTVSLRFLIGGAFLFASLPKIFGERFTQISTDDPVGAFFECIFSLPLYWNFLGWSQAIAGLLLITQRFALVGAMAFFGIILNIYFITLSLEMRGTPYVVFMMLLATTWLLFWDFDKWKYIFLPSSTTVGSKVNTLSHSNIHLWIFGSLGLLLLATGLALLVALKNLPVWFAVSAIEVIAACGLSIYFHKKGKKLRI